MTESDFNIPFIELFDRKKVDVDGIIINYAEAGEGKTLICIHGWTNDWTGFIPVGKNLIDKYRVILIDLPGFGESGKLPNYTLEILAEKLKRFSEVLKLEDFYIVAHSMGTCVEAKFYELYPEACKKMVFIGGIVDGKKNRKLFKFTVLFFEVLVRQELGKKIVKKIIERRIYAYFTAKFINMYKFNKQIIDQYGLIGKIRMTKEAFAEVGREIVRSENWQILVNNKIPMLFIYGKYDKITPMKGAVKCLEGKGNYEFVAIDEAGHIVTVEKPEEVAKEIKRFID